LVVYVLAVVGVLIASYVVGDRAANDGSDIFAADKAWWFITLLTIGYMVSRGLAKAGAAAATPTRGPTRTITDPSLTSGPGGPLPVARGRQDPPGPCCGLSDVSARHLTPALTRVEPRPAADHTACRHFTTPGRG
jgi:hypothetical protein